MRDATHGITSPSDRIEMLLSQLTLEEQVALLAGADFSTTVPTRRATMCWRTAPRCWTGRSK